MNKAKLLPRSRLLATLEDAIKKAPNPIDARCLRAERAALLLRRESLGDRQVLAPRVLPEGVDGREDPLRVLLGRRS